MGKRQHHSGKSGFNFNFYFVLTIFPHCFVNHSEEREQSNKSKIYSNEAPECNIVVGGGAIGGLFLLMPDLLMNLKFQQAEENLFELFKK